MVNYLLVCLLSAVGGGGRGQRAAECWINTVKLHVCSCDGCLWRRSGAGGGVKTHFLSDGGRGETS